VNAMSSGTGRATSQNSGISLRINYGRAEVWDGSVVGVGMFRLR
jgi:hypothetical protein